MTVCEHSKRIYVRATTNKTTHYGVQCTECLQIIKTVKHGFRPWIKHSEIPLGEAIYAMETVK